MTAPDDLPPDDLLPARDARGGDGPGLIAGLGSVVLRLGRTGGELAGLLLLTLRASLRRGEPGAAFRQMYEVGNRSLLFLCVVMGFVGMILVYQAGIQTLRVVPDLSRLGGTFLELLIKDLAPSLCALMLATRVGAGIAAELGSMQVTEQIDALKLCAADPIEYLVRPRFIASLLMTVVLVILAGAVAVVAGTLTAQSFFGIAPRTFLNFQLVGPDDVATGIAKCLAYGAAIPVISSHAGLAASGGSEGVGTATTRAVVNSSLAVVALDLVISGIGYVVFSG